MTASRVPTLTTRADLAASVCRNDHQPAPIGFRLGTEILATVGEPARIDSADELAAWVDLATALSARFAATRNLAPTTNPDPARESRWSKQPSAC